MSTQPNTFASTDRTPGTAAATPGATATDGSCRRVPSDVLLQGHKAVEIHHNGAVYRLQSTKLGKLILTK